MTDNSVTLRTEDSHAAREPGDIAAFMDGIPQDLLPWVPSTDEVAILIYGRTSNRDGRLQGTFTATSQPTDDQAAGIIRDAVDEVLVAVPWPLPDAPGDDTDVFRKAWRRITALLAAANIELSYPSNRGGLDRYDRLVARQNSALKRLIEAISESGQGGGGESVESAAGRPLYSFPDAEPLDY